MVQYIFTPWRDRRELLKVRRQFYRHPPPAQATVLDRQPVEVWSVEDETEKRNAVARVFMWMHRGNCPHVVESTALLMSAILEDRSNAAMPHSTASSSANYAVLAAYMSAFSRFVTGLLDSHQDKQRKLSMYGVAKQIGLPASFVELRHQATHEPLPPLTQLRTAARKALAWIWDYYWKNLPNDDDDKTTEAQGPGEGACRQFLTSYLQNEGRGGDDKDKAMKQLRRWDDALVLKVLSDIGDSDSQLLLKTVRLSREILGRTATERGESTVKDFAQLRTELEQSRRDLKELEGRSMDVEGVADEASKSGWTRYPGVWTPKPIGAL